MSRRTYILAAFFGLLVGGVVWFWPVGPMWVSPAAAERICGFSSDGRILVTCSGLSSVHTEQQLCRWDADTGKLLSRAVMACDEPKDHRDFRTIRPSPDGNVALVAQGVPLASFPALLELATGRWFLHDAITGKRLLGPISGVNYVDHSVSISLDGRWFAAYRGDPDSGVRASRALGIYSAETGDNVVEASAESGGTAMCRFAPDGKSAAVWLAPKVDKPAEHVAVVQLFELPSGRLRRQAEIRSPAPLFVHDWDGRYLAVADNASGRWQCVSYDFTEDIPRARPDPVIRDHVSATGAEVHWQAGRDWVAFFVDLPPNTQRPGIAGWLDWLDGTHPRQAQRRPYGGSRR